MSAWNALGNPQMACPSWLCIILGLCIPHCHLVRLFELNLAFLETFFLKSHDAMSIQSAHLGVKMNCFKKPVFRNENRTFVQLTEFRTGHLKGMPNWNRLQKEKPVKLLTSGAESKHPPSPHALRPPNQK